MANKILLIISILLLTSCSVYKGSFDCNAHRGIGCESVSKVNELVNDDRLDEFTENHQGKKASNKNCPCKESKQQAVRNQVIDPDQEKITIHFNEYQESGITHKESEIEVGA